MSGVGTLILGIAAIVGLGYWRKDAYEERKAAYEKLISALKTFEGTLFYLYMCIKGGVSVESDFDEVAKALIVARNCKEGSLFISEKVKKEAECLLDELIKIWKVLRGKIENVSLEDVGN